MFSNEFVKVYEGSEGHLFTCVNQELGYRKAKLFGDYKKAREILTTTNAHYIATLFHNIKGVDTKVWSSRRYGILQDCLKHKFAEPDMRRMLLKTLPHGLAFASLTDTIFGIGLNIKQTTEGKEWRGENLLGTALESVRFQLNNELVDEESIYFYGEQSIFSNFHKVDYTGFNGLTFHSSEQEFMYRKALTFNDKLSAEVIMSAESPLEAKRFGRGVKNYDDDIWGMKRHQIMIECLHNKFKAGELGGALVMTGAAYLCEASPYDSIWGIGISEEAAKKGQTWYGQNLQGEALMRVRQTLAHSLE